MALLAFLLFGLVAGNNLEDQQWEGAQDRSALFQSSLHIARPLVVDPPQLTQQRLLAITGRFFDQQELAGVPMTDEPWRQLEWQGKVFSSLEKAVKALKVPVSQFLLRTERRKAILSRSTFQDKATSQGLRATVAPVVEEWRAIAGAVVSGFNSSEMAALLSEQSDVLDSINSIIAGVADFSSHVEWLESASATRVDYWGSLGKDVVPAQLEAMKSIIQEFAEQKDKFLQLMRLNFEELEKHLRKQIRDNMELVGQGACVDAVGAEYTSFEPMGCETPLECLQGCRAFPLEQCRGATINMDDASCGRCKLRMEQNISKLVDTTSPSWQEGSGVGEIVGTVAADSNNTRCFRRLIPEWLEWPASVRQLLEEDMVTMEHNYAEMCRSFRALLFQVDRGFWQVESGFDVAAPPSSFDGWF